MVHTTTYEGESDVEEGKYEALGVNQDVEWRVSKAIRAGGSSEGWKDGGMKECNDDGG
jgi:hypothetical protein